MPLPFHHARVRLSALGITMTIHFDIIRLSQAPARQTFKISRKTAGFSTMASARVTSLLLSWMMKRFCLPRAWSASVKNAAVLVVLLCVTETFYLFGFKLNFGDDKIEALLRYVGKDSAKFKHN